MVVSYDCMSGRWSSCNNPAVPAFMLQMEDHFSDFKFWDSHSATAADTTVISAAIWKDYVSILFCGMGLVWVLFVPQPLMGHAGWQMNTDHLVKWELAGESEVFENIFHFPH